MNTAASSSVAIGSGGIGAADNIEPALDLAASGEISYLAFDCLAERTLALAQVRRMRDPESGYDERLPAIVAGLSGFLRNNGRLVGNFGAANPGAAAIAAADSLRRESLHGTRIGVVHGDDVMETVLEHDVILPEMACRVSDVQDKLVSAHAYIGAEPIVELLERGCQVILGGRIADPSVYVGPICHELGWALDDWDRVGTATLVAHLLECGIGRGERDDVLREPGYPFAVIGRDGTVEITKLPGTEGRLDAKAVKLHLGYEVHDPAAYLTPDVSVDFSKVWVRELGPARVTVGGATGHPRPDTLKVLVGLDLGWKVVAEVSYGGRDCVEKARTAAQMTQRRLEPVWKEISDHRVDLHGVDALFGNRLERSGTPPDVRLRVAFRCDTQRATEAAVLAGNQLYSASRGGGGVTVDVKPAIGVTPAFLPRSAVPLGVEVLVA